MQETTTCCIVGGGPAGMMLGLLLARAGVPTTVLEKHADFLRDFRGDTVHPSTLRVLDELGLLDRFLERPHQRLPVLEGWFGSERVRLADFSGLPARYAFIAMVPQWHFLDFLAEEARRFDGFTLHMRCAADALVTDGDVDGDVDGDGTGRVRGVRGVRGQAADGPFQINARCTVACDGRRSTLRELAGLAVQDVGAPIDVLWFGLPRDAAHDDASLARIAPGRFLVTIARGDRWQCAFVVPKGGAAALQQQPIDVLRQQVGEAAPFLLPRLAELRSWDDVKLLTVAIDRLLQWSRPGLLCIGDAAHAMSPVGGVGINLAIQDAVATANLLADSLLNGTPSNEQLDAVRRRRLWPTKVTQAMQVAVQNNLIVPAMAGADDSLAVPAPLRLVSAAPALQRMLARLIGMGVRPEHVRSRSASGSLLA